MAGSQDDRRTVVDLVERATTAMLTTTTPDGERVSRPMVVQEVEFDGDLWSKPLETWFPDGLDTPGLALLKVHGDTAEYWDAATSRVKQLVGMGRAIRRDDPDEFPVDNRTVDL